MGSRAGKPRPTAAFLTTLGFRPTPAPRVSFCFSFFFTRHLQEVLEPLRCLTHLPRRAAMLSCPVRLLDGGRLSLCRAPERRSLQCHARRRRRSGGDEPAGAPAEALVSQLLERLASKEDLDKLASKEDLDKLASKEDLDKLAEKVDAVDKKVDAMSTLMGSLYDAAAAGVPEDRRRIVYRNPLSLAADCGLPHDAAAGERVAAVLVEKVRGRGFPRMAVGAAQYAVAVTLV